jgi:(R,R)-butanediol dehydrogenase/meso-butanediol dehydrogenase/diacetyl reductase
MTLPETMTAARWHARRDIRIDEIPTPVPHSGQVLLRVGLVGLCGTDLEEYREGPVAIPPAAVPLTLGHEIVGTVVDCPGGEVALGTRVIPDVVVSCGTCWWCQRHEPGLCPQLLVRGQQQDGGLAEYMVADAGTVVAVPDGMDNAIAAFAEPCAVAVRAMRRVGDLAGASVCVYGAGSVGLLITQLALASPAAQVITIDPVAARRHLAAGYGATACSPDSALEQVQAATSGRGADVVIECAGVVGAPATAVRLSRAGATVILLGIRPGSLDLPGIDVVLGERRILGSAAHVWDVDVASAIALLDRGVLDPRLLHSTTVPLRNAPDAFRILEADRMMLKLLVAP